MAAADPAKKGQVLDEDDEFEDFNAEDWTPTPEDLRREGLWDKTWDDDAMDDHVGQQLRAQLMQPPGQQQPQQGQPGQQAQG